MRTDCPACGGDDLREHRPISSKLSSPKVWPESVVPSGCIFSECAACGHVFLADATYPEHGYREAAADPDEHPWFFTDRDALVDLALAEMRRLTGRRTLRILDFGCAYGNVSRMFLDRGQQAVGYDIAEHQAEYARSHYGIPAWSGRWEDAATQIGAVDVIFSQNVFEHLPDPRGTLSAISANLASGGIVYITVPNFESEQVGYRPQEHLHYFRPRGLARLVERAGFRVCLLRSGRPGIEMFRRLTGRIPPLGVVRAVEAVTRRCGWHGYSITIAAKKTVSSKQ